MNRILICDEEDFLTFETLGHQYDQLFEKDGAINLPFFTIAAAPGIVRKRLGFVCG
jgi:hypothetical protein